MFYRLLRDTLVFILVIVGFILLLLLPREMDIHHFFGLKFFAHYPFEFNLYLENINTFIEHLKREGGLGKTAGGTPLIVDIQRFLWRSLKIILPAFVTAMVAGVVIGILLFPLRNRKYGQAITLISELFAAIPDFFLFISAQYLILTLMKKGFFYFELFNYNQWYSFMIPALSLTLFPLFHMIRITVSSMHHEAGEDYVQTALSKGMSKRRVVFHVFANSWLTIVNQSHMVLLYILSSLPIIEKLSNYHGAGYQLLESIINNENVRALAFFMPFLLLMFLAMILAHISRGRLESKDVRHV